MGYTNSLYIDKLKWTQIDTLDKPKWAALLINPIGEIHLERKIINRTLRKRYENSTFNVHIVLTH